MLTATGNGAIRRDYHDMDGLTSPGAQTFTPPFPTGSTLFVATEVSTNVAIGVSAKTVSGFTLSGASAAGGVRARVNLVV